MFPMKKRTLTGITVAAAVYLVVAYSHIPVVIRTATALLSAVAAYEILTAANLGSSFLRLGAAAVLSIGLTILPMPHYNQILGILFPAAVVVFAVLMAKQDNFRLDRWYKTVPIVLLVVVLFRSIAQLRLLENGLFYLIAAITVCFATDVAAYLIGSRFGRHKLAPRVSPNKTVEGSLAGIGASVLALVLMGLCLQTAPGVKVRWLLLMVYGVSASVVGQFGDLSMSVVKRIWGVKDFGKLLPGHGGILDRFDSHLFCVAYTLLFCAVTGGFLR